MEFKTRTHMLEVNPEVVRNIRKSYNLDTPERLNEAIDILEQWLQKQNHILKKDFTKQFLEKALITCKGSVEKAKKQIDRICTSKTLMPHFFEKTDLRKELQEVLDIAHAAMLPKLTDDYYRILAVKITNEKLSERLILNFFQYIIIGAEFVKSFDYVDGFITLIDLQDTNMLELVTLMNPVTLQQLLSIIIEGYGARMKGIYFLTQSKAVELLVKLVKQLLNSKIGNRIRVFKTNEELHKFIPKHILPEEYGGPDRSIFKQAAELADVISNEENVAYIKEMFAARTDENLRPSDQFNDDCMGMPGSFRNMTVD